MINKDIMRKPNDEERESVKQFVDSMKFDTTIHTISTIFLSVLFVVLSILMMYLNRNNSSNLSWLRWTIAGVIGLGAVLSCVSSISERKSINSICSSIENDDYLIAHGALTNYVENDKMNFKGILANDENNKIQFGFDSEDTDKLLQFVMNDKTFLYVVIGDMQYVFAKSSNTYLYTDVVEV